MCSVRRVFSGVLLLALLMWLGTTARALEVRVVSSLPPQAAIGVARDSDIMLNWSATVDGVGFDENRIQVRGRLGGSYPIAVSTEASTNVLIHPLRPFVVGDDITVSVATNAFALTAYTNPTHQIQFTVASLGCAKAMFGPALPPSVPANVNGVALGDLDGDGDLDLWAGGFGGCRVFTNDGLGNFQFIQSLDEGVSYWGVAVADLDGDGDLDGLACADGAGIALYANQGNGRFTTNALVGVYRTPCVAVGDLDGDGDLDLLGGFGSSGHSQGGYGVYLNSGGGTFITNFVRYGSASSTPSNYPCWGIALGDLDRDGDMDAFFANHDGRPETVYANNGAAGFSLTETLGTQYSAGYSDGVALGDLDGDGDLDAVVANHIGQPETIFLNTGTGAFVPGPQLGGDSSTSVVLGDLDSDGDLDILVGNAFAGSRIYSNTGGGSFVAGQTAPFAVTAGISLGDVDGDGDLDAVHAKWYSTGAVHLASPDTSTQQVVFASSGSPLVAPPPPSPDQNAPGDQFDLNTAGNALSTVDRLGFGSLGRVYVNHDATNLYVGGTGLELSGSNNFMMVFLGLNTLTNDITNMAEVLSVAPDGLGRLDNLRFGTPMDVAILLGDEHGDGTFPSFLLDSGQDAGQGVFHVTRTGMPVVAGAALSQYDGTNGVAVVGADDDGNREADRWEASIPWASLNAGAGIASVTQLTAIALLAGGANGDVRYLSGNFMGSNARTYALGTACGDFGWNTTTVFGTTVQLPPTDYDGDRLPNGVEMDIGLNPADGADGMADADGDGQRVYQEYIAGTNPSNGASFWRAGSFSPEDSALLVPTMTGRLYNIDYCDGAVGPVWNVLTNDVSGTGGVLVVADPDGSPSRVYRVRVKLAP